MNRLVFQKSGNGLVVFADVDGKGHQALFPVKAVDGFQGPDFLYAEGAPGRPEVDEDHLALEIVRQGHRLSLAVRHGGFGKCIADLEGCIGGRQPRWQKEGHDQHRQKKPALKMPCEQLSPKMVAGFPVVIHPISLSISPVIATGEGEAAAIRRGVDPRAHRGSPGRSSESFP